MSTREMAIDILNGLTEEELAAFVTLFGSKRPNAQTIEAMNEIESGGGTLFVGTTEELFSELARD